MDKIAVLIPCYNEAKTIKKVVEDFKRELPEATIYVYDNNSKDGTDKIAKEAGAIVKYETRQGKGNVIRTMFREIDAEAYVMVDGDDTYPAESAREMVNAVCDSHGISVTDISCGPDYCYISINVPPNISAAGAIAKIKGYTGRRLLEEIKEFSKTQNIWTRNYLVSTKAFSQKEIDTFVEKQVTHY